MYSKIFPKDSLASTTSVSDEEKKRILIDRSLSRGRQEGFQSSGRGGAGNIRPASRDSRPVGDGPDDFSPTRGRELNVTSKVTHSGRGGAGNIRSPSRDPTGGIPTPAEQETILHAAARDADLPHSSGRGGFGNIVGSQSRSPSRPADVHSSGRGGAGNIVHSGVGLERLEEQERRTHLVKEGIHSSGRGGAGNLVVSASPGIEVVTHPHETHEIHSSGRGGAGNIREASKSREASRSRDASRVRDSSVPDTEGTERIKDHGLAAEMWDRVMGKEKKE